MNGRSKGYHLFMAAFHISALEVEKAFPGFLEHAHAGSPIVIDDHEGTSVVLEATGNRPIRPSAEILADLEENGSGFTLDNEFGRDVQEFIDSHREPMRELDWD